MPPLFFRPQVLQSAPNAMLVVPFGSSSRLLRYAFSALLPFFRQPVVLVVDVPA